MSEPLSAAGAGPSAGSGAGPTPELEIAEVDPFDDAAVDAWHATYLAAERHGHDEAAPRQLEEVRVLLQQRSTRRSSVAFSGRLDGRTVCAGWWQASLQDNLERAQVAAYTAPDERRRGHGTAMLAHLERVAGHLGRRVLDAECSWSYRSGAEGRGEPGPEFAYRAGYSLALTDVQRSLALPVAEELLERLAAEAAGHHAAYTLRSWAGPVPEDLVLGWARLTATLTTEAPTGDRDLEPEAVDVGAVREGEELVGRQGRTTYDTVALDADGAVVAYTELVTTVHEPGLAYQWGTLVRRADRGHRLGVAVKVANLRLLQRERPDLRRVTTWNAEVNAPMVAVNELLGFVPVARLGEFEKRLG